MRQIVIGDVHGCLEELDELLRTVEYVQGRDRLLMVGDLIDRGPDPRGVVRRAMELRAKVTKGNHEEKCLRWLRNEDVLRRTGRPNRMHRPPESRRLEWESLSADEVSWLDALPLCLELDGWTVVHAGFEPGRALSQQRPDKVMRVRWVDKDGHMVPSSDLEQPEGSLCWMELWRGPKSVVYGHAVHSLSEPRVDDHGAFRCVGVDTGCVFGGRLTAMLLLDGRTEFVSVPAKREYMPLKGRKVDGVRPDDVTPQ